MKVSIIFFTCLIFIAFSCKQNNTSTTAKQAEVKTEIDFSFSKTHQAKGFTFNIKANNGENSTILLESSGLENEFVESRSIAGQLKETFMLDIDNNGDPEFYLAISPTGDSRNIDLKAFITNSNKSISEATIMDQQLGIREMNSDQISSEDGALIRRFKVDGKEAKFKYMLMQSEAGYLVIPMLTEQ